MALTQVKTLGLADGTDGHILSYDANGKVTTVGPGTDGQVLTSTGAGSPPAFENLPASGVTVSNNSNNRVVTGDGSNLNAEAKLTFDGSTLDIDNGNIGFKIGGNVNSSGRTDDTYKLARLVTPHYHNAEEPMAIMQVASDGTDNIISYGGSWNGANAATRLSFYTAANDATLTGTERLRITSDGRYIQGHTASITTWGAGLNHQIHGTSTDASSQSQVRWSNDANGPSLHFAKSRGGIGTQTIVQDNDNIGGIAFLASDGNDFNNDVARIDCNIDGSPSNNTVPGEIVFTTTKSTGQAYNNMKIRNDGNVEISNGNVVIGTAGKGIDFSVQADDGSNINELFDDYEEGTWTPIHRNGLSSPAYSTQQGYYVKCGNVVTATFRIVWGSCDGNGGHLMIGNVPFAPRDTEHDEFGHGTLNYQNVNGGEETVVTCWLSGSRIDLYKKGSVNFTTTNGTSVNNTQLYGGVTYRCA